MNSQSADSADKSQHKKYTASKIISNAVYFAAYPYIAVGRAGIAAGSYAISAPIHVTKRITNACAGTKSNRENDAISDAFNVHEVVPSEGMYKLHHDPLRAIWTATTSPKTVISYSGKMLSDAVLGSRGAASKAIVASGSTAIRAATGLTWGMIGTLWFTTSSCVGLMDYSTKMAISMIPTCVTNAAWHGMEMTGTMSTDLLALSIGMPIHKLFVTFFPQMQQTLTQEDCVQTARSFVINLFRVFGPQNAFYLLKSVHDTIRSEELHDMFSLAEELLRELTDQKNLLKARQFVHKTMNKPVSSFFELCPSIEEVADLISMAADVTNEVSSTLLGIEYNEVACISTRQSALDRLDPEGESVYKLTDHIDDHSLTEDDSDGDYPHETFYCNRMACGDSLIAETSGFCGTFFPEEIETDPAEQLSVVVDKGLALIASVAKREHSARFFDFLAKFSINDTLII